ncbi:FemAB family protein [Flavobacterium sp.]|uniref:FemAB family protein n=1 Tax=Flavobacterium sp. TaxID=239 RepID=UPI0022C519CF|nr:FemAB family protein [Flavobacterium sp.]MCZ8228165.1 FemAB family protein [Flavobacterium sp.]
MKNYSVRPYQESDYELWNTFVSAAYNATFLFHRDFMEYHQDRFDDFSLLVFDKVKLVAVLPANRVDNKVYSHQGLTYGGLVYASKLKIEKIETILDLLFDFFKSKRIEHFYLHPIPSFYLGQGNAAIDFFLMKKGAQLYRKEMNMVAHLPQEIPISKSKLKHFRRTEVLGLRVVEETNFQPFWEKILEPRLVEKYDAKPVHSLAEIQLLHERFPKNIKQFSAYLEDKIVAGITIFEFENGVKSQYGATSKKGEKYRALDFLFISLLDIFQKKGKLFFDMGIVNDSGEKGFHSGLLQQKEELGCTVWSQDFYKNSLK